MGSINVLENYTKYYNLSSKGSTSTGIVFSIFQIGQMSAALFVWVADWQGRKRFIFIGTIGVILGTIVTSTAKTLSVFIGGRFLLSFFATCACSASPLYLVEVAPPQYRGTLAGMYNTFYYFVSRLTLEGSCSYSLKTGFNPCNLGGLRRSQAPGTSWQHRLEAPVVASNGLPRDRLVRHSLLPRVSSMAGGQRPT